MAFTSTDLVRTHLDNLRLGETPVGNVAVIVNGVAPSQLPHGGLINGSIVVKARRSLEPIRETRALGSGWIILGQAHLVDSSVVAAKDSSLGQVYVENVDFVVDHAGGRIRRIDSGAIGPSQSVVIWYAHYYVYSEGDDYSANTAAGQITRKSTGLIADGQQVLVDYTVALSVVSDTVIDQAINESGEAVLSLVSESFHDGPTPGIVIGATHMAVAQLARMRAGSVLADGTINAAIARAAAQLWLDIATQYDHSARTFLSRFANPISPRTPLRRG
jgi:hypothetical protein